MKIHHLNCGCFCPLTVPLLNPDPIKASCHCLLVETEQGLVLVDSGYSRADVEDPVSRLGLSSLVLGVKMDLKDTAYAQVQALGFQPEDVKHVVLTHLDTDHVGGVMDFPWAQVHVFEEEFHIVRQMSQKPGKFRNRFRPQNWSPDIQWNFYSSQGEAWNGFESVRNLKGLPPEILMIPLIGHSPGHCGVVVDSYLHAGDSYFQRTEVSKNWLDLPVTFQIYQSLLATNNRDRMNNQKRLRKLIESHPEIDVFCSHDLEETQKYIPNLKI